MVPHWGSRLQTAWEATHTRALSTRLGGRSSGRETHDKAKRGRDLTGAVDPRCRPAAPNGRPAASTDGPGVDHHAGAVPNGRARGPWDGPSQGQEASDRLGIYSHQGAWYLRLWEWSRTGTVGSRLLGELLPPEQSYTRY